VIAVAWRWRARRAAAHRILAEYARIAILLLLGVAATGTISAIVVLPGWSALTSTGYGRLLLTKIALILVTVVLAIAGRRRLQVASPLRDAPAAGPLPGRATRTERLVLGAVLAVTAVLVSVAVPGVASGDLSLPPPPAGPVVRLASLAGQVTINITASDGQLVVRTSVPNPTGNDDAGASRTEVGAELGPAGHAQTLRLRRCGPDCFVGPAPWVRGTNVLTVTGAAKGWAGGSAAFTVAWPPVTDTRLLAQVLAEMRAAPAVTVHETVTSDTTAPTGPVSTNTLTGRGFLATEPYSTAGPLPVTVLTRDEDTTVVAVAMVDQGYYFRLSLAADHRITGEVITAPEHLITRTFDYPRTVPAR